MKLARSLIVALLTAAVLMLAMVGGCREQNRSPVQQETAAVEASSLTNAAGDGIVQLPPEVLLDRLLLRAERLLAAGEPAAALEGMNEIVALQEEHDLVLEDGFDFQYAQVAYAAGRTETAIASLNDYLLAAGREGEFYREALELLDSAEGRLQGQFENTLPPQRLTEALRAAAEQARDLTTIAIAVAGGTIVLVVHASYHRPDAWVMRMVYLFFPFGWFYLVRSIYFGSRLRSVYLAHLFSLPDTERDFLPRATAHAEAQRNNLEYSIYVFAVWLSIYLLWWIWPVPICKQGEQK